ncbi:hypothetical protein ABH923_002819 [Leifsonia sp. EB41]|uniref:hypothetical protein n=1 Tax=Leifsonia sp. EB41 TaxID=3156260 RepID=UPI0035160E52
MEDRFGLPDNMFGPIDDDFAGALGRIAMLGALIESKVDNLVASLDHNPQSRYAGDGVGQQLTNARKIINNRIPARPTVSEPHREQIRTLLQRIETTMFERNELLHGVWARPSFVNGLSWRHLPKGQRDAPHEWTRGRPTTAEDLYAVIAEMVAVVGEIQDACLEIEAHPRVEVGR